MLLTLQRDPYAPLWTSGRLAINGIFEAYTIERSKDDPAHKCVGEGTFKVTLSFSPRFDRLMPHIEEVPGRSGILIHWGNHAKDSEGCVLVGREHAFGMVMNSRLAFAALYDKIEKSSARGEEVRIEIVGASLEAETPALITETAGE